MCLSANVSIVETKAKVTKSVWDYDNFLEERFNIIPKALINGFELNYLGYGGGGHHDATFGMYISLCKTAFLGGPFDFG